MTSALFAMGNALVDLEYSVTDAFLATQQLDKGSMQLADAPAQQALLRTLNASGKPQKQAGGGSAANTAYAFSALGGACYYGCRVANDTLGHFYIADLKTAHIQVAPCAMVANSSDHTGTCVVLVTADGERTLHTHLGISAELAMAQIDLTQFAAADIFYIEGYLATSPSACQTVVELRKLARIQGKKIALTLSDAAMITYAYDGLLTLLGDGVDILFCNADEARGFTQTATIALALEKLQVVAQLVVITDGADGAWIGDFRQTPRIFQTATTPVSPVIDTNGAGDAFAGCFLYGVSVSLPLETCAQLAHRVSAHVISRFGPRLNAKEYKECLSQLTT